MSNPETRSKTQVGWWSGPAGSVHSAPGDLSGGLARVGRPLYLLEHGDGLAFSHEGRAELGVDQADDSVPLLAVAPACRPRHLGSASFARDHGVRFCYVAGAMANGIASAEMVEAMGRAGMLAFFGAAGLGPEAVEDAYSLREDESLTISRSDGLLANDTDADEAENRSNRGGLGHAFVGQPEVGHYNSDRRTSSQQQSSDAT